MPRRPYEGNFSNALRSWAKERKMPLAELARRADLSYAVVLLYAAHENSRRRSFPTLDNAMRLARALDITLDQLVTGVHGEGLPDE